MHQDFQAHGYPISEAVHLGLQGQEATAWWKDLDSPQWIILAPLSQGFSVRFGPYLPSLVHIQLLFTKREPCWPCFRRQKLSQPGSGCTLFMLGRAGSSLVYGFLLWW